MRRRSAALSAGVGALLLVVLSLAVRRVRRPERTASLSSLLANPTASHAASCVPDFAACAGGVLSPVKAKCCNPKSICFRRGRYFSQCRPRASTVVADGTSLIARNPSESEVQAMGSSHLVSHSHKKPREELCAPDYAVCAAGADASSRLPCCSKKTFDCVRSSPLFHQCLPDHRKHASISFGPEAGADFAWHPLSRNRNRYAYLSTAEVSAALGLYDKEPLSAGWKLRPLLQGLSQRAGDTEARGGTLRSSIPAKLPAPVDILQRLLRDALPAGASFLTRPGEVIVTVSAAPNVTPLLDAAMVLASFPFVRDVRLE